MKVKCLGWPGWGSLDFLEGWMGGKAVFPRLSPIVSVFATKDRV